MAHSIQRVALGFMAAFGVLALVLGVLSIASPDLAQRDDNLRRVFAEQRIQRGAIVDRSDQVLAETTLADSQSEQLMFYVQAAGIKPADIEAVAVAQGPGSYSGLRGSLAAAKSLAQIVRSLPAPLTGSSATPLTDECRLWEKCVGLGRHDSYRDCLSGTWRQASGA